MATETGKAILEDLQHRLRGMGHEVAARARVMVIDDEPLIRSSVRRVLMSDYEVVVPSSATAALHMLLAGERFDIVLSDLRMPDKSGLELHADLLAACPDQARRMVFMTGGPDEKATAQLAALTNPVIDKTLVASELKERLRGVLAELGPVGRV